jgi:hypothetical protein
MLAFQFYTFIQRFLHHHPNFYNLIYSYQNVQKSFNFNFTNI